MMMMNMKDEQLVFNKRKSLLINPPKTESSSYSTSSVIIVQFIFEIFVSSLLSTMVLKYLFIAQTRLRVSLDMEGKLLESVCFSCILARKHVNIFPVILWIFMQNYWSRKHNFCVETLSS